MNRYLGNLEKTVMAAAFAEAGEHETARQIAGIRFSPPTAIRQILKNIEACFTAVAFAEENCHQYADPSDYLPFKPACKVRIHTFLRDIGLQNVRVRYGVVLAWSIH